MIGEIIQEYLVSLGVQIDKPGFRQMDDTIRAAEQTVTRATGSWAANFVKASGIIGSAIAGVTASVGGLMRAAARNDLEMEKYARSMLMSREAAEKMKRATDALGESINDISLSPELYGRFQQLTADGSRMQIGGDFKETMKDLRDVMFEFTRLKQEASYAMTWIGYYLAKYLQKPLADIREKFRSFNDSFVKNMSVWTEKAAKALVYIINIGKHFLDFLFDVGKALGNIWDSFPKGVKIATAAVLGFWAVLKMTPLGRMMTLVSGLLLLIDDYYGYMEGKQAAFGEYWDKLNAFLETAKEKWEELRGPIFDAVDGVVDFIASVKDSRELAWFVDTTWEMVKAFGELAGGIVSFVADAINNFLEGFDNRGGAEQTANIIGKLGSLLSTLYQWTVNATKAASGWLEQIGKDKDVREFMAAIGEMVSLFVEFTNVVWELVETALKAFFEASDEGTEDSLSFADALREVLKFVTALIRYFNRGSEALKKFLAWMKDSTIYKTFWKGMGSAAQMFLDVVTRAVKTVGKLGQALLALTKKDYKLAASLAGDAWDALLGKDKDKPKLGGGGGGSFDVSGEEYNYADPKIFQLAQYASNYAKKLGFSIPPAFFRTIMRSEAGNDLSEHWQSANWNNPLGMDFSEWHREFGGRPADELSKHGHTRTIFPSMEKAMEALVHYFTDEDAFDWAKKEIALIQQGKIEEALRVHFEHYVGNGGDINESAYPSVLRQEFEYDRTHARASTKPVEKAETISEPSVPEDKVPVFSELPQGDGEGNYWVKQHNDVSYDGARPETMAALDLLGKWFFEKTGKPLVITAVTNGESHADGEYSHYAGWKIDANDWGSGAEGALIDENNMLRGWLADAFIKFGQSLGLGMNREGEGTESVHFDISVAGQQWEGAYAGANFGGLRMPQQAESGPFMQLSASVNNLSRSIRNAFAPASSYGIDGAPTGTPDLTQEVQSGILTPIVQEQPKQQESVFRPVRDAYSAILGEIKGVLVNIYQAVVDREPDNGSVVSNMEDAVSFGFDRLQDAIKSIDFGSMIGGAMPAYAGASGPVSIVNTINLGGITVNGGANASAKDIGTATANEVMSRLDRDANYLYTSRSFAPNTIHVSK